MRPYSKWWCFHTICSCCSNWFSRHFWISAANHLCLRYWRRQNLSFEVCFSGRENY
jgi:hypothetical protein